MPIENDFMRELHAIRERMYEETKDMTLEERFEHGRRDFDEQVKKLGITLRRPSVEDCPRMAEYYAAPR